MNDEENINESRRRALGRLGALALSAYTIPVFTTMSMAHASESSAASDPSEPSVLSEPSEVSEASEPSDVSAASEPSEPREPSEPSLAFGPSDVECDPEITDAENPLFCLPDGT